MTRFELDCARLEVRQLFATRRFIGTHIMLVPVFGAEQDAHVESYHDKYMEDWYVDEEGRTRRIQDQL